MSDPSTDLSMIAAPACSFAAAVCALARQPREAPRDPCAGLFDELPARRCSAWLLTFLAAARALANWSGEEDPPAPDDWRERERRMGLRPAQSLWAFDADAIWTARVESVRGLCITSGWSPAAWVARWAPSELAAVAHVDDLERRNAALSSAAEKLHALAMGAGGPVPFGRDLASGRIVGVDRASLFARDANWVKNWAAEAHDGEIRFTDTFCADGVTFTGVGFASGDIAALLPNDWALEAERPRRTLVEACRQAAIAEFPAGPPAGISASTRNDRIAARVERIASRRPSARVVRDGIKGLWAPRR